MSTVRDRIRVALRKGDLKGFCETVRAARSRDWMRTGGARYARQRVREARAEWSGRWPGKPIPDGALAAPARKSEDEPPQGYVVLVPSEARPRSLSAAATVEVPSSRVNPLELKAADAFLESALGPRWSHAFVGERIDGVATVEAAGHRHGRNHKRKDPIARRLPLTRTLLMRRLSKVDRHALKRAGAIVMKNAYVQLPKGASPNEGRPTKAGGKPNDLWHLDAIGFQPRPDDTLGKDVLVGVLDTAVDLDHPEIEGKVEDFICFAPDVLDRETAYRRRAMVGPAEHGTAVAALCAGRNVGIARDARLLVASVLTKVTSQGIVGQLVQVSEGMEWLIERAGGRPIVFNASLAVQGYDRYLTASAQTVEDIGNGFVGAIGNWGPYAGYTGSPGNYANVIGVGAVDRLNRVSEISSWLYRRSDTDGFKPDLCAPGEGVPSALAGGGYGVFTGTSYAAPIVTGIMAVMLARNPAYRRDRRGWHADLFATCTRIADPRSGRGVVGFPPGGPGGPAPPLIS